MSPTTLVPSRPVADDPLYPSAGLLPLGRQLGAVDRDDAAPTWPTGDRSGCGSPWYRRTRSRWT